MSITTTQYKAAIEAKIAAANGSTPLRDLTLIKTNADLWLLNNPSGSIDGYASLEALIQTIQNALVAGTPNTDLSFVGASAFPPKESSASFGFKNKVQITTSQDWVVPAGVYRIQLLGVGGGGAGGSWFLANSPGSGGAAGCTAIGEYNVTPGDTLSILIGAGGLGVVNNDGSAGGLTRVLLNGKPLLFVAGGASGSHGADVAGAVGASQSASFPSCEIVLGGSGGKSGSNSSGSGGGGSPRFYDRVGGTALSTIVTGLVNSLGKGIATNFFSGGGGGSSWFGKGGDGASGSNSTVATSGGDAPLTNYGAGGGGSSGQTGSTARGGNGAPGIVEISY